MVAAAGDRIFATEYNSPHPNPEEEASSCVKGSLGGEVSWSDLPIYGSTPNLISKFWHHVPDQSGSEIYR